MSELRDIENEFIVQWGTLASQWGVTKTIGLVQALLMTSEEPMTTDQIMERLSISRGNAHASLKELVSWNLIRKVHQLGVRKELYEAEKDPWKLFFAVARERRRREIEPVLQVLRDCEQRCAALDDPKAENFHQQLETLADFVGLGDRILDRITHSEKSMVMQWLVRMAKKVEVEK